MATAGAQGNQYVWPVHDVPPPKKPASRRPAASGGASALTPAPPAPASPREARNARAIAAADAARTDAPPSAPESRGGGAPAHSLPSRKKPVIASLAKPPPKPERPRLRGSLAEQVSCSPPSARPLLDRGEPSSGLATRLRVLQTWDGLRRFCFAVHCARDCDCIMARASWLAFRPSPTP